jgi:formate hydrogenlyase subunit 3/multisubunit Na+/H+ antiporter MnhD subunit
LLPILLPLVAGIFSFLSPRTARIATATAALGVPAAVGGLFWQVWRRGPQLHTIGGWGAPLGVDLYADGLATVMLLMTAVVGGFASIYALGYFAGSGGREGQLFYPLWLFLWAALSALFLSDDIFNQYVTLELVGLASAPLITLGGQRAALTAGMRYLLMSLVGSLFFLLGVALLYASAGTLSLRVLSDTLTPIPATWAALTAMTVGMLMKTALVPLHFWLPPAHANAPAPVSAVLSALVVKASFYLLLRLWFDAMPEAAPAAGHLFGMLGATAILWGSLAALRQPRLKLMIAYSTVAQVGYLFLLFPLATKTAWDGGIYCALAHGCAKAAMFMAAGNIMLTMGHDRIDALRGVSAQIPLSVFAFALSGITLMGLPPSGGFAGKWLLLTAAIETGQWWFAVVIIAGGLLAAAYVYRVVREMFLPSDEKVRLAHLPRGMELAGLGLAVAAFLLLGMASAPILRLLE